jgi:hypothetical protein
MGSRNKAEQTVSAFGRPWEVGIQAGQPEEAVYGEEWRVWACEGVRERVHRVLVARLSPCQWH